MTCPGFLLAWSAIIASAALVAAAFGLQTLIAFIAGVIAVIAASLAAGLTAAAVHHRRGGEDERLGP
jgi:hypothetical protein